MPKQVVKRGKASADRAMSSLHAPMPITKQERDLIARQSRRALRMAKAAGVNDIKQHHNPDIAPG